MLQFFRKIRQKLLITGKTTKYVNYALGEIILVVIGILIALQINNWNENRKLQAKSLNYLKRLKIDLDNVSSDVNRSFKSTQRKFKQARTALEALENKKLLPSQRVPFEKHLLQYFQFQITIQNTTAYNEMISSGDLGLIENQWLRTEFAELADSRDFILEVNQSNHSAYKTNANMIEKYVRYTIINQDTDSSRVKVNYNFDHMANDDFFINQISNQAYTWWDILRMYESYETQVNTVRDSIVAELKRFD